MDAQSLQSIKLECNVVNARCANANLRRANRAITQLYDQKFAAIGLQATQFTLLTACAVAGSAPISALAEALVMDRTTLARNLKPLATRGLVKVASGTDRRIRMVTLSQKGYTTLTKALPLWHEAQQQVVKGFGQDRLNHLLQDLSVLTSAARNP